MKTKKSCSIVFAMTFLSLILFLVGCKDNLSSEDLKNNVSDSGISEQKWYAPTSAISISDNSAFNSMYTFDTEEIENVLYELFPNFEQYSSSISITKIYSEAYLPYMESLYLTICNSAEREEWLATTYEVPMVWMYLINLPNSKGYLLLNADKRVACPLVLYKQNGYLNPEIFNDFGNITQPLCAYGNDGQTSGWMLLDTLYRNFAYETFGWPFPYYELDFITSWNNDMTSLHQDPNSGGGGSGYPTITYTSDTIIPNHVRENGIYKWTDYFPTGEYLYPRTGTIPLSVVKTMAYKRYVGEIGHFPYVDLSSYVFQANPVEPYQIIFEVGDKLYSYYDDTYTTTDPTDAIGYLDDIYTIGNSQYFPVVGNINLGSYLADDAVLIYDFADAVRSTHEWQMINGMRICTKISSAGYIQQTISYLMDGHTGDITTKRILNGNIIVVY